jgi:hypothetical protein
MMDPDFLHIGLVGIREYESFWRTLRDLYKKDQHNSSLNDVEAISCDD